MPFWPCGGQGRQNTNQGQTSGDLSGIPSCEKEGTPAEGMLTCSSTCCLLHLEKSPQCQGVVGSQLLPGRKGAEQNTGGKTMASLSRAEEPKSSGK